MNVLLALGRQL